MVASSCTLFSFVVPLQLGLVDFGYVVLEVVSFGLVKLGDDLDHGDFGEVVLGLLGGIGRTSHKSNTIWLCQILPMRHNLFIWWAKSCLKGKIYRSSYKSRHNVVVSTLSHGT